ncbi:hypothetical protein V5O48_014598 [Marasmius crinis-equi]|uniref:Uncharacterized protein n=1 Tax=Marasmius crinis-equi TaxID=585013 RepID=A0ABR3EWU6_9AGAR
MASEDLIEEALAESFSPPPLKRQSLVQSLDTAPPRTEEGTKTNETPSSPSSVEPVDVEAWKSQYEEHVKEWRAQNAEAREKAEQERARWEAIREQQKEEKKLHSSRDESSWHTVSEQPSLAASTISTGVPISGSPSVADARDLVSGEAPRNPHPPSTTNPERQDTWEDLPSELTSSYPSMSFPSDEQSSPPEHHKASSSQAPRPPLTATAAVFDTSLTTGTRVKALCASLAINLLLPFVNGVMLGFGEIFAKNVVLRWLGWNTYGPPGSVASSLGLGSNRRQR